MSIFSNAIIRSALATSLVVPGLLLVGLPAQGDAIVGTPIDIGSGQQIDSYQIQFSPSSPNTQAYGFNGTNDTVAIINPTTATFVGSISLTAGSAPVSIAFTPDGEYAYVANYFGGSASIIDTATNTVVDTVSVAGNPYDVTISHDGRYALFSCYGDNKIRMMSTATNEIVRTYRLKHSGVWQARFTPNDKRIYAVANDQGSVIVLDATKKKVITKISLRGDPWWLDISPDGKKIIVADYREGNSSVSVISAKKNKVISRIAVGSSIYGVTFTPDGDHAYATNPDTGEVSVIDMSTLSVVDTFTASGASPLIATFHPAGTLGYIGDRYGMITSFTPY